MALALYRKYRPQIFADVIGQDHVTKTLLGEVATNKIAHAYLFSGPRGTGKTSMARIFAKAVNCTSRGQKSEVRGQGDGEPCNLCEACATITAGRALDVIEIDAASHRGIDTVRDTIIGTARFAPSRLKYKLFILDEAHMLTGEAWNALLKIIEEPPAHLIFIFATTEAHKVPATILSRCQRFDFRRIASKELVRCLVSISEKEGVKVKENTLQTIARLSEGCLRDAEGMLDQLLALGEKEISEDLAALVLPKSAFPLACDLLQDIISGDAREGIALISRAVDQGVDLNQWCGDISEVLRYMILLKIYGKEVPDLGISSEMLERIESLCEKTDMARIVTLIGLFSDAKMALKQSAIPQLPLEVAVVRSTARGTTLPDAVIGRQESSASRAARPEKTADPRASASALDVSRAKFSGTPATASMDVQKRNEAQPSPIAPTDFPAFSLTDIKAKWPEVLKRAEAENHSLLFLLSTSRPVETRGNVLSVGVQYPFHRDKLNEQRCRTILESIVQEIYLAPFKVESVLQANPSASADTAQEVAQIFGGSVIK